MTCLIHYMQAPHELIFLINEVDTINLSKLPLLYLIIRSYHYVINYHTLILQKHMLITIKKLL